MEKVYIVVKRFVPISVKRFLILFYRRMFSIFSRDIQMPRARRVYPLAKSPLPVSDLSARKIGVNKSRRISELMPPLSLLLDAKFDRVNIKFCVKDHDECLDGYSSKSLIFVESSVGKQNYSTLTYLFKEKGSFIVFRTKKDYLDFLEFNEFTAEETAAFDGRLVYIQTIDPVLDEIVYGKADRYAEIFLGIAKRKFSSSAQYKTFSQYVEFVKVGVSDRFVGWVRNYYYLSKFVDENNIAEIYVWGGRSADSNLIAFSLAYSKKLFTTLIRQLGSNLDGKIALKDFVSRDWAPLNRSMITKYRLVDNCRAGSSVMLFFGNFKDPMYRGTLQPVLDKISENTNDVLLVIPPYVGGEDSVGERFNYISPEYVRDEFPGLVDFNCCIDSAIDDFLLLGFDSSSTEGLLRSYVTLNARKSFQRLLRDCYTLMCEADKLVSQYSISALVSNPGRLWPSQFLTGYLDGVSSFEIQSGTLSKSKRYKKPNSKYIMAVDDFSRGVYVDFLGVDGAQVNVVGAPRIDEKLADIRRFNLQESRSFVGVCGSEDKVICVATQPYDIELMSAMVDVISRFVEGNEGWFLLLSMHPNENDAFENSYKSILKEKNISGRYAISRGNIYHNLNSSDFVATYFSTAGLEAFCLGKPVLAYRPVEYKTVPFDLCELGVAKAFSTFDDFSGLVLSDSSLVFETESLRRLKDGRSVERISKFILNTVSAKLDPIRASSGSSPV